MATVTLLAVFPLFVFLGVALAQMPSACSVSGLQLTCMSANYTFPETFNITNIPQNVQTLYIGADSPTAINVLNPNFLPIPARGSLSIVVLRGFQDHNNDTFPLNNFLRHVRHGITTLYVYYGVLKQVTQETFDGFGSLRNLRIGFTGLRSMDVNSFAFRPLLADGTPPSVNSLTEVWVLNNNLTEVDWAVFAPHAASLQLISLEKNQISAFTLSRTFRMPALKTLYWENNNLSFVPPSVLHTLDRSPLATFFANNNAFCPLRPDCGCCELEPLVSWIHYAPTTLTNVVISCGAGDSCSSSANNASTCVQQYNRDQTSAVRPWFKHCSLEETCPPAPACATQTPQVTELPADDSLLAVTCIRGRLSLNFRNLAELQSIYFHGDHTLKCRHLLLELHESAVAAADEGNTTTAVVTSVVNNSTENDGTISARHFLFRHDFSPLTLACVGGVLEVPDVHPWESESSSAFLGGDGSLECGRIVNKVLHWAAKKTRV